jgi:hypothetical protein
MGKFLKLRKKTKDVFEESSKTNTTKKKEKKETRK